MNLPFVYIYFQTGEMPVYARPGAGSSFLFEESSVVILSKVGDTFTEERSNRPKGTVMFDYSYRMKKLIADISRRCQAFNHIDSRKILVGVSRSRNNKKHGLQAKLVPLKFQGGRRVIQTAGDWYCKMPKTIHNGREILYAIYFCLPRFQNLSFDEKMMIIFHELYHINPAFNGDIRRFPGKYYQHSRSEKEYDGIAESLSKRYLSSRHSRQRTRFLRFRHEELRQRYGEVTGLHLRLPEPILFKRNKEKTLK